MGPFEAVRTCLRQYVTFSGRAARPEFWWFMLAVVVTGGIASGLDMLALGTVNGPISALVSLATIISALAAGWRRLHDTGRSGWWQFMPLLGVPVAVFGLLVVEGQAGLAVAIAAMLIAEIWLIVLLAQPGELAANRFGSPPAMGP